MTYGGGSRMNKRPRAVKIEEEMRGTRGKADSVIKTEHRYVWRIREYYSQVEMLFLARR